MKLLNIAPFLVLHHTNATGSVSTSMPQVWNTNVTSEFILQNFFKEPINPGWPWSVRTVKGSILSTDVDGKFVSDYILVGHATVWEENVTYVENLKPARWLYAHKSICFDCPAEELVKLKLDNQKLYRANVKNGPDEVSSLYYPLGTFGSTKNGKCVAVLRAFLYSVPWPGIKNYVWEECCGGPMYFLTQGFRRDVRFINTLQVKKVEAKLNESYEICVNVDEAIDNWISGVVSKGSQNNSIFQGFLVAASSTRNELNASAFMRAFCNSTLQSIAFPNICACLGRAGVEDAFRLEVNNNSARMVCQSKACVDADRSGNVYTFVPSPPCAAINICKQGLDINAARLAMTNVTFNCGGIAQPLEAPPAVPAGSPPAVPAGSPPAVPAGSTTPLGTSAPGSTPPAGSATTNIIIGSVVGVVILIVIIVVTVVLVKKKRRAAVNLEAKK